jgi:hypothetical protein
MVIFTLIVVPKRERRRTTQLMLIHLVIPHIIARNLIFLRLRQRDRARPNSSRQSSTGSRRRTSSPKCVRPPLCIAVRRALVRTKRLIQRVYLGAPPCATAQ